MNYGSPGADPPAEKKTELLSQKHFMTITLSSLLFHINLEWPEDKTEILLPQKG